MLKQWLASLESDLALLSGLKSISNKNDPNNTRAANIRATEKRINDARREIEKLGRK